MKRLNATLLFAVLLFSVCASPVMAAAPDFSEHGFPDVVASQEIDPSVESVVRYDGVEIDIPAGAFKNKVKFEVLEGPLADFDAKTSEEEMALMNFAFRVMDLTTNELVGKFEKPVMFSYTNDRVNAKSKYYDVTIDGEMKLNKIPATIEGTTLKHPVAGAGAGWVVTSPQTAVEGATAPVTGIPVLPYAFGAAALVVLGVVVLASGKRSRLQR